MRLITARIVRIVAVVIVTLPLLGIFVAWLGIYNVAASAGHPFWFEWFLQLGMTRSVTVHSNELKVPDDLDNPDRIRLGAAHFQGGCAECHGAPGRAINPVYESMLPSPPDLATAAEHWEPQELYWIVLHGLQFTGMPNWSGGEREDEIWSMVAFLLVLPELDENSYRAMASGNSVSPEASGVQELVQEGTARLARAACDRCHDIAGTAPPSQLVPRLAGQSTAYLIRSLDEYKRGERRSGFMQPVAAALDDAQIEALAAYYSELPPASGATDSTLETDRGLSSSALADAALIASGGNPDSRIPACLSCHGDNSRNDYPSLNGQHAPYLAQQLSLMKAGQRQQTAWGEVMAVIASRLSDEQINALAVWFSMQQQQEGVTP